MAQSLPEREVFGDRAAYAERLKIALGVTAVVLFALWVLVAAAGKALTGGVGPAQWMFVGCVAVWPVVSWLIARRRPR